MIPRILGFAIAAVATTSIVSSAAAQLSSPETITPPSDTIGLTPIAGEIRNVQVIRVPKDKATSGAATKVTLNFKLQGCLDSLLPLITHSEVQGRRATLYITALNAHSEGSKTARCVAVPQANSEVTIPGSFQRDRLRVVFVGASANP